MTDIIVYVGQATNPIAVTETVGTPVTVTQQVQTAVGIGGTVTTVSIATANGLSGTVANPTTTPAITLDISGLDATKIGAGSVSNTEFGYLDGVTSAIQTQLDGKQATGTYVTNVTGTSPLSSSGGTTPAISIANAAADGTTKGAAAFNSTNFSASAGVVNTIQNISTSSTPTFANIIDSGLTASTAVYADSSKQLASSATTNTELGYLSGVTSSVQTQINTKQATITGGATTIASSNLTVSRALVSDGSGKVAVATTTSTEIGYVNGVTSALQTQIDAKAPLASPTFTGTVVLPTVTAGGVITFNENSSLALDPAGSADGKYTGITVTGTSGYTQAFGDVVMLDVNQVPARWELADCSVTTTSAVGSATRILAIVVGTATDGNTCTLLLNGIIRADANFPTMTVGGPVYISTTGDITSTQPSTTDYIIRVVGFALTADEIYFNPSNDYITHT